MTDLTGKVALVTGSARGLGRAIAERYAELGASVVVNYASSGEAAEALVAAIVARGGRATAVQADVALPAEVEHLFATALERFGRLDIAVANAGVELVDTPILEVTEEDYDRLFAINAKGAFFTLQQAARHVGENGRIIYVGSSSTAFPVPGLGLYGASKMAPRYLVEVLAKEVGGRGVTVNSILPTATAGAGVSTGGVRAELQAQLNRMRPIQRMGTLADTADAAEYLASDLAGFVSGQHLLLSGGGPS